MGLACDQFNKLQKLQMEVYSTRWCCRAEHLQTETQQEGHQPEHKASCLFKHIPTSFFYYYYAVLQRFICCH